MHPDACWASKQPLQGPIKVYKTDERENGSGEEQSRWNMTSLEFHYGCSYIRWAKGSAYLIALTNVSRLHVGKFIAFRIH